jgi:hypothetical protein
VARKALLADKIEIWGPDLAKIAQMPVEARTSVAGALRNRRHDGVATITRIAGNGERPGLVEVYVGAAGRY